MKAVRTLFVNSGMLGHSSVASLIRDAVAQDATVHATHIDLARPLNLAERIRRAALCARPLGRTNLDYARWRSELHSGLLAARRIREVGDAPDVLHFHTQATAYASLGLMADVPSIVSIDITQRLGSLEAPPGLRFTYRPNITRDGAVFRKAAAIISTSKWAAQSLATEYPDCAAKVTRAAVSGPSRSGGRGVARSTRTPGGWCRRPVSCSWVAISRGKAAPIFFAPGVAEACGDRQRLTIVSDWQHRCAPGSRRESTS